MYFVYPNYECLSRIGSLNLSLALKNRSIAIPISTKGVSSILRSLTLLPVSHPNVLFEPSVRSYSSLPFHLQRFNPPDTVKAPDVQ